MRNKFYALILLAFCFSTVHAQIYFYTNDTSGAYNSIAANATGVKLTRYNGAIRPGSPCAEGFSSQSFTTATTYSSTLPAIEADVTPNSGYQLNVTSFRVGMRRSNTGPADAMLAYSTDGGTTWTSQGTIQNPKNSTCADTIPALWTTTLTVASPNTLKFRIYGYDASAGTGTLQLLNLEINGTVTTGGPADSIATTATAFGPFCMGLNDTISVPFTETGTFTGLFQVQMSDASGIFPNDATSNIISTGSATSPVTAIIPSTTAWANGYRVRVVNATPTFYNSGSNGTNIVINQSVTPAFVPAGIDRDLTICGSGAYTFTAPTDTFGGNAPVFEWSINGNIVATGYSYSATFANNDTVRCILVSNAYCAVPNTITSPFVAITVAPSAITNIYDTICPGASYTLGTKTYTSSGTYSDTTSATLGCDSITILNLTVRTYVTASISQVLCPGTPYTLGSHTYTTGGTYTDTTGCDSIVTLTLSYKTVQRTSISASICPGTGYLLGSTTYTTAGTYSDTVRCDSIVTLTLTIKSHQNYPTTAYFCHGGAYFFNGTNLTSPGTYRDTIGCDSIVVLTLNYGSFNTYNVSASFCPGGNYTFEGTTYTTPVTIRDTLGCDSIVVLTLTYKTFQTYSTSASFCHGGGYLFNGITYTSPGTYRDTVGCDSILILTLSYGSFNTYNVSASFCPGGNYTFEGTTYTSPATVRDTLGCDSIVVLTLTYKTYQTYPTSATFCHGGSYAFGGTTYFSPGRYRDTVSCDSIIVLTLSYGTLTTYNVSASFCSGSTYTFEGTTYSSPGTYRDTLGCDSIVVLALTYKTYQTYPTAATFCHGSSYVFGGTTYFSPGTYSDTIGCDSIVVLTLTYGTLQNYNISASICPGSSYDFYGTNYSSAGSYIDTIGCDSIVTLTLGIKTQHTYNTSATFCHATTYTFYGTTLSSPGTYTDTVSCDSIVVLSLSYGTLQTYFSAAAICSGGSYIYHGTTYTTPGTYTDTLGCDSILVLALIIDTPAAVTWTPAVTSLVWCGTITDLVLSGASPAGGRYSGEYVSGDTLYNIEVSAPTWVTYTYTDGNHCSSLDSVPFTLSICNGITQTSLNDAISIYPNPTDNVIHLDVSGTVGISSITITDMLGQTMMTITGSGVHQDIDLSSFSRGLYLLTVRDAANGIGSRVIVRE